MEKKKIFSKINIKDYNNQLEKIVEKKHFSGDVKSLLLSMLYKIEISYVDYNKVKTDTATKKEFIQEIFSIIENDCEKIELTQKMNIKFQEKEHKTIYAYNEQSLIYELYNIKNRFQINNADNLLVKLPMERLLNIGYSNDKSEIIRDFDGWSWNINKNLITNITYNLIYQNIRYLTNNSFLKEWKDNSSSKDYMQELKNKLIDNYNKTIQENVLELIMQISILEYLKEMPNEVEKFLEVEETCIKQLNKLNNKTEYIQEIVETKKQIGKKINCLDKIINNRIILEKEFINRNAKLEEKEKIFSLSDLTEILSKERKELINELKKCNELINPQNYTNAKSQQEKKTKFLINLDLKNNDNEEKILKTNILFQKEFLRLLEKGVDKKETKKQIIEMFYILRYYKTLPINKDLIINEIAELKTIINRIEKKLITKGCNSKFINIISYDIQTNYKIISKILYTKIINLNEITIELKKKDEKNIINIYDDNTIDTTIQLGYKDEINLKYNKRIKLFI